MKNAIYLKILFVSVLQVAMLCSFKANATLLGDPPGVHTVKQDSSERVLGHCQPHIEKKFNCAEGTIELSAYVLYLFTGQNEPQTVLWSTGQTAHKIVVTPPGTWSWDASNTGCEVYHFNTSFSVDAIDLDTPTVPLLIQPANGITGVHAYTPFVWSKVENAAEYLLEVAWAPTFSINHLIVSLTVTDTSILLQQPLGNNSVYYWRVKAVNHCSESDYTPFYAFQTGSPQCNQVFSSTDLPGSFQPLPDGSNRVISNIDVPVFREMVDVNVSLNFIHPTTGELSARLVSPEEDTILLFDRPGVPATANGCGNGNGNLIFDQQATQAETTLEAQCNNTPPALNGTFRPVESLGLLNGSNVNGQWQMILTDHNGGQDTAAIASWKLTFCLAAAIPPGVLSANNPLYVVTGESDTISSLYLKHQATGSPSDIRYALLTVPLHGTLLFNGVPLTVGKFFTQNDIDFGKLIYLHNGDSATADEFKFDVLNAINYAWLPNQTFHIVILPEPFTAVTEISQPIYCHDGSGEITVHADGLGGNYTFSLNGGPAQTSNVFQQLAPGTYVVTVTSQSGVVITTLPVTLVNPPPISIGTTMICDQITIQATAATPPLQYSIDGGALQSDNKFNDLAIGPHVLFVQDVHGCEGIDTVSVSYIPLDLSIATIDPKCNGNQNGKITVTPIGGQAPFVYKINGGANQSSGIFSNLPGGTYQVSLSDNQGCKETSEILLINPPILEIAVQLNGNNISIQASGGTGSYMYSIGNAAFQADSQYLNVPNGTHQLRVRDVNGCIASTQVTINVLSGVIQGSHNVCIGELVDLTINASGGMPPYEYQLNGAGFQMNNIFDNLGPGIYIVTIRDFSGTEIILNPFECIAYDNPSIQILTHCDEATITISGGTPPYVSNPSGMHLTGLPNGVYPVTVTDAKGCKADTSFEINAPLITTVVQTVDVICYGDSTGSATINAMGGTSPYLYSLLSSPYQSDNTFENLPGGWYYYAVQDSEGCVEFFELYILQPDSLGLLTTIIGNTLIAEATGGTGSHKYSLNNGPEQSSGTFDNLAAGIYFVTAFDELECSVKSEDLAIAVNSTEDHPSLWSVNVWPNPGNGLYNLHIATVLDVIWIEVFNISGQLLQQKELEPVNGALDTTVNLTQLPDGVYVLRLTDGSKAIHLQLYKN